MKSYKEFKPSLSKLGERIYHQRTYKNLAAKEIAHQLSLTAEAYRNIEKGESDISFTTLLKIAVVLKMEITELIKDISIAICLVNLLILFQPNC